MYKEKIFKNFTHIVSKLITSCALYFTIIVIVMSVIGQSFGDLALVALPCEVILWTLLFSFFISVALVVSEFMKEKNLNSIVVYGTHFILSYLSFLLVYVWLGGANAYLSSAFASQNKIFTLIIMSFFFIGIYVFTAVVKIVLVSFRNKLRNKNTDYKNIYSEDK